MKPSTQVALRLATRPFAATSSSRAKSLLLAARTIHNTTTSPATVSPIHGTGPPPPPPHPSADSASARISRRKKHAELLEQAQDIRTVTATATATRSGADSKKEINLLARRRFWKHVHVRDVDSALEVHLDARPLRRPNKEIVRLPASKPLLAAALAVEWDLLTSAQQAAKQHLIPLTSLTCRALDIADDDAAAAARGCAVREGIVAMLLRYLDTDSLLCWAPPPRHGMDSPDAQGNSLRELQRHAAEEVVGFLTEKVWPGIEIVTVLDGESIVPRGQDGATRLAIETWIRALDPFELAGLERATLAGKGLLGAVRLLVEWSEGEAGLGGERTFGVEEAVRLASIEINWQIGNWGEVEDTHDVEREDLRRQLGSVVLLVSGSGK